MKRTQILIYIFLLVILVGCQQSEPTKEEKTIAPAEASSAIQDSDAYPYPEPVTDPTPYEAPETPTMEPYIFRVSVDGTVTVHGVLAVMDPSQALPDPDDGIFLVPLPASDGVTMVPTFEIGTVPQADVDERTGEFVFTDIEPGQYIVMVYTLGNAKIPARNDDGGFAILKISETDRDQTIEVNYLRVP